ncbi:LptA/OstA family protein [Afifella sp. IM 167]|uniref:LptA/OstA family protein n=1 Tax=Afifella sp. IM 167 TaxID=2033586 RepID=UPI001CCF788C|nr:LptA/OstA family protein [Afifella sp. IM 167]
MKPPFSRAVIPALALLIFLAAGLGLSAPALAQGFGEAFGGFSSSSDDPILVEADRLEVRDEEKIAIYSGNVKVRQAETVMQTAKLIVHYTGNDENGGAASGGEPKSGAAAGAGSGLVGGPGSSITIIEAEGGVRVNTEDKTATGDRAVFDMKTEIVTLYGNVVLTQGDNVLRGERLVVNLKTKKADMQGGRVQTIIAPNSNPPGSETAPGQ